MDEPIASTNGDGLYVHGGGPEIHQATEMLTGQLGVSIAVAFAQLHAHAQAHHRRPIDVARDIVARRLELHPNEDPA